MTDREAKQFMAAGHTNYEFFTFKYLQHKYPDALFVTAEPGGPAGCTEAYSKNKQPKYSTLRDQRECSQFIWECIGCCTSGQQCPILRPYKSTVSKVGKDCCSVDTVPTKETCQLLMPSRFWARFIANKQYADVRFVIARLSLIFRWYEQTSSRHSHNAKGEKVIHANVLIFDKHTKTLRRFEPYGAELYLSELEKKTKITDLHEYTKRSPKKNGGNQCVLNKTVQFHNSLNRTLEEWLPKNWSFMGPEETSPVLGVQYWQELEPKFKKQYTHVLKGPVGGGFCATISAWYTDQFLAYANTKSNLENEWLARFLDEYQRNKQWQQNSLLTCIMEDYTKQVVSFAKDLKYI